MKIIMLPFFMVAALLLAGCASPSPEYFGAQRYETVQGGITFTVYHKDGRAEVIRHGYLRRGQRDVVPGLMLDAIRATTGCEPRPASMLTRLPGDTGEARFRVDCPETLG